MKEVLEPAFADIEKSSWPIKTLGAVCRTSSGGTPSRSRPEYFNGSIPWVKSGELTDGLVSEVSEFISEEALAGSSAKLLPAGTLLIAMYGATVGKLGVLARPAATNQAVCAIFPPPEVDPKFLFWYLRRQRSNLITKAVGGAQPNISQTILRDLELPIPPFGVQREIVAEIEKQFSRLDEAVANLQRVKANLKRYKAAVLKAAVEGRLVETEASIASREGRSYVTGEQLLRRILEERRAKWTGKKKLKEPVCPEIENGSNLPNGWARASIDQLASVDVGFAFKSAEFSSDGVRLLRGENIEPGKLRWRETKYWPESRLAAFRNLLLAEGEIILAMDRPLVSAGLKLARVKASDLPCLLVQRVARLRCVDKGMESYLHTCMSTQVFEGHLLDGQTGTQLPHVSGASIGGFVVPVPPASEQIRIAAEVDRQLSIVREVEAEVDTNLQRAQMLRRSTLAKAFANP